MVPAGWAWLKVGDFGILSTLVCDNNTTTERSWRVEGAGTGTIRIISSTANKDQFNSVIDFGDVESTIDSDGNIVSLKLVTTITASNYTLTMVSI